MKNSDDALTTSKISLAIMALLLFYGRYRALTHAWYSDGFSFAIKNMIQNELPLLALTILGTS